MSDKSKAMEDLFDLLAVKLLEKLKDSECTATDLNVIRQFLRDNNITATTGMSNPTIHNIVENLPYDEDGITEARH